LKNREIKRKNRENNGKSALTNGVQRRVTLLVSIGASCADRPENYRRSWPSRDGSIKALTAAGYRVIAPDQIGLCKSSKPERYQFTRYALGRLGPLSARTHRSLTMASAVPASMDAEVDGRSQRRQCD
jgi:pimeloyl-ACP methyl ester carboxylesterase